MEDPITGFEPLYSNRVARNVPYSLQYKLSSLIKPLLFGQRNIDPFTPLGSLLKFSNHKIFRIILSTAW